MLKNCFAVWCVCVQAVLYKQLQLRIEILLLILLMANFLSSFLSTGLHIFHQEETCQDNYLNYCNLELHMQN